MRDIQDYRRPNNEAIEARNVIVNRTDIQDTLTPWGTSIGSITLSQTIPSHILTPSLSLAPESLVGLVFLVYPHLRPFVRAVKFRSVLVIENILMYSLAHSNRDLLSNRQRRSFARTSVVSHCIERMVSNYFRNMFICLSWHPRKLSVYKSRCVTNFTRAGFS